MNLNLAKLFENKALLFRKTLLNNYLYVKHMNKVHNKNTQITGKT